MKVLFQDYTFDPSLKQVRFNTTDTVSLSSVLLITNVTSNVIIYNFANPAQGGSVSNNILTLDYDTTSMSSSDSLQIFLDLYGAPATENTTAYLKRIIQLLSPLSVTDSNQRQRVVLDTQSNVNTVNLINQVTNIAGLGGVDPRFQFIDAARLTYAQGIRRNLQFS